MKKSIVNLENPNGILVDETPEEVSKREADTVKGETKKQEFLQAKENQKTLKASAKAKLVAGEALTQEEADTIVL